jgi:large subunit ribosomal protein L4
MATVEVRRLDGSTAQSVELDEAVFGIEPNVAVMHQVVTAQLGAARAGTHSTRTRAEVRGGGAKPWRQKGTGRSRQGSSRSPQWQGGGVALGPKPRSYRQRTPRKMVQLALRSALSDRAAADKVVVVDSWAFDAPRTKDAVAALATLGVDGRVLLVLPDDDVVAAKSFRNLPGVAVVPVGELNAHDVLLSDWVVFTLSSLPSTSTPSDGAEREESTSAAEEPTAALSDEGQTPEQTTGTSSGEGQVPEETVSPSSPTEQGQAPQEGSG